MKNKISKKKSAFSYRTKQGLNGWWFVAPFAFGLAFFYIPVFIESIWFTFNKLDIVNKFLSPTYIGLENYRYVLQVDPDFIKKLVESIRNISLELPVILIFSLFLGTILNQQFKGRFVFRIIFFLPVVMITGIIEKYEVNNIMMNAVSRMQSMGTTGETTQLFDATSFLANMGIYNQSFQKLVEAISTGIYDIVKKSGVQIIVVLAGLQAIPVSIYEGARLEGATGWEIFWKITFPMILPILFVNAVYTVIDSFTRSSNVLMEHINDVGFERSDFGIASAMSWIYTIIILIMLVLISLLFYFTAFREKVPGEVKYGGKR